MPTATLVALVFARSLPSKVEREGQQIEVGGNERYVSLWRKHFSESIGAGTCADWRPEGQ